MRVLTARVTDLAAAALERFWRTDAGTLPGAVRPLLLGARVLATVVRDLADGQLSLRAMSLVYTTLLSLVPLLAVSFSVSQAFGVHNRLEGTLIGLLAPLGDEAARISDQIVGFVENVNVKVLGSFGLGVLVYTVVSLTQKVESAVNHTWRVHRTRGFFERFSRYLSVILVGPLLVVTAMGVYGTVMTSSVVTEMMNVGPIGELRAVLARSVPYLLVMAAFTFVYVYIPNTRVKFAAALTGGVVAGMLWTLAGGAFAKFVVSSTAYAAIYSSFAILVLFLIWLYVGWLVLLIGAAVAFYTQHPEQVGISRTPVPLGGKAAERLGLELIHRIAEGYCTGRPPRPLVHIASDLNVPVQSLRHVALVFEERRLIVRLEGEDELFVPARDVGGITLAEVVDALRDVGRATDSPMGRVRHDPIVERTARRVDAAVADALGGLTLRDLGPVSGAPAAAAGPALEAEPAARPQDTDPGESTMSTLPHGAWPSPLSPDAIVADSVRLGDVCLDGEDVYWVEGRPAEKGRQALVSRRAGGAAEDVLPADFSVRTRVHEYGGTAFTVAGGVVWFCNDADGRIYRRTAEGITALTPDDGARYAEPVYDAVHGRLYCVRERAVQGREPVNDLVGMDADGTVWVVAEGHHFFATPRPSPDGNRVAFITWDHPRMPWDGTDLWVAGLDADGRAGSLEHVAGGPDESVVQPEWSAGGVLHFVSDRSGWWNLHRHEGGETASVHAAEAEFGRPHWVFGLTTYGFLADGRIGCVYGSGGTWHMATLDPSGELTPVSTPFTNFDHVRVAGHQLLCVAGSPERASAVVLFDLAAGTHEVLRSSSALALEEGYLSRPESIWFDSDGSKVHAFYHPPTHPTARAPAGELAPLIVIGHGGPTSATAAVLDPRVQFWTTRGFAVVDVNYRGSTGFGRAYRDALKGGWGVVDVADCVNAARHLAASGRADPERLIIRGGSAGGFTALAALCFHDVFAVAASYYGISELEALATDTHKFESRYLDSLIGPYPQRQDLYRDRSPINHVDKLNCPAIFFQGLEDRVVPPNQAEMMVAALEAKGLAVEYHAFEGEQHGFRQAQTIKTTLRRELAFYGKVLGFSPAPESPA